MSRARPFWQCGEPVHAVIYYAPERRAATDGLGLKGGWMSYFGRRAAPLGAVGAPIVTTLFYNFHPRMVARAIPDAWAHTTPDALLDARITAMDAALRRVLGDDVVSSPSVARAAELAGAAVSGCDMAGHPLGAANQAVPEPGEPHLRLWQALTAMREHRGDGHANRPAPAPGRGGHGRRGGAGPQQPGRALASVRRSPPDRSTISRRVIDVGLRSGTGNLVIDVVLDGADPDPEACQRRTGPWAGRASPSDRSLPTE